jgi:hypothetical protein
VRTGNSRVALLCAGCLLGLLLQFAGCGDQADSNGSDGSVGSTSDASPGPVTVTVAAYSPPAAIAFQDGDGPWRTVDREGDLYRFSVTRGSYVLAYVCRDYVSVIYVIKARPSELGMLWAYCIGSASQVGRRWTINFNGFTPGSMVRLALGQRDYSTFTLLNAARFETTFANGVNSLIAAIFASDGQVKVLSRDLVVQGDGTLDVDLGGAQTMRLHDVLVTNADPGDVVRVETQLAARTGITQIVPSPAADKARLLDPGVLPPGDNQVVSVTGAPSTGSPRRSVERVFGGQLGSFDLPPKVNHTGRLVPGTFPSVRAQVTLDATALTWANLHLLRVLRMPEFPGSKPMTIFMYVGAQALGAQTTFEVPELSGVPGVNPDWDSPSTADRLTIASFAIASGAESNFVPHTSGFESKTSAVNVTP